MTCQCILGRDTVFLKGSAHYGAVIGGNGLAFTASSQKIVQEFKKLCETFSEA